MQEFLSNLYFSRLCVRIVAKNAYTQIQKGFFMSSNIKLVALDMDGTLFNHNSEISKEDAEAIRHITERGIHVVISTGRPFVGLPVELLNSIGIHYAITTNAAGIYTLPERTCLHADPMEPELICPILTELLKKDIHMDAFIHGDAYSQTSAQKYIDDLIFPDSVKEYIRSTRTFTDDLVGFIREKNLSVEKMTLNFLPNADGTFHQREEVKDILRSHPEVEFLSGGFSNLEFTKRGVNKGNGLCILCDILGCSIDEALACGDSQNDLSMIQAAGIGVAMGNASAEVKKAADFVTLPNEESGVAYAIHKFVL